MRCIVVVNIAMSRAGIIMYSLFTDNTQMHAIIVKNNARGLITVWLN